MRSARVVASAGAALASLMLISSASAIPVTIENFQDGTTMGWIVPGPSPNPPVNIATGGPAGAGDRYLQLTSTGLPGAGGRLAVINDTRWGGDYIAAGLTSIVM